MAPLTNSLPSGLYVHIPFCQIKCRYCDFAVFPGLRNQADRYLTALEIEMGLYRGRKIDTAYFGGGTPSLLSSDRWKKITRNIRDRFALTSPMEITVECNPENITRELIDSYKEGGVNRLSLGLQTSDNGLLKKIGRTHTWEDFLKAYSVCRKAGINNLSVDLMFGLPGQSLTNWKQALRDVLNLRPEHLSLYPLDVEKKSAFYFDGVQVNLDLQAEMYEWSWNRIEEQGYDHYEVFSYSLPGFQCRHNLKYWKNDPCIGIGLSAAGYDGQSRYRNTDRFWNYIESLESGKSPVAESEDLPPTDRLREAMMLGLRLKEGIPLTSEIHSRFGAALKRLEDEGCLRIPEDGKRIVPTCKGWLLSNYIYRELMEENCAAL